MASSELPKTGGSEGSVWTAETEEFNRDKAIEVLEEVGTFKILAEAAAAFGSTWGGVAAKREKMMQASTMMAPSRHTAA